MVATAVADSWSCTAILMSVAVWLLHGKEPLRLRGVWEDGHSFDGALVSQGLLRDNSWIQDRLDQLHAQVGNRSRQCEDPIQVCGLALVQPSTVLSSPLQWLDSEEFALASALEFPAGLSFFESISAIPMKLVDVEVESLALDVSMKCGTWRAPLQFKYFQVRRTAHWLQTPSMSGRSVAEEAQTQWGYSEVPTRALYVDPPIIAALVANNLWSKILWFPRWLAQVPQWLLL